MALDLSFDELLRYTNDEREKWRRWFQSHPEAMDARAAAGWPVSDRRQAHRSHLSGRAASPAAADGRSAVGVDRADRQQRAAALRLRGVGPARARAVCRVDRRRRCQRAADDRRPRADVVDVTPRKLLFHILIHEIRHWAQIALAVRLAGLEPPGDHDLFYQPRAAVTGFRPWVRLAVTARAGAHRVVLSNRRLRDLEICPVPRQRTLLRIISTSASRGPNV